MELAPDFDEFCALLLVHRVEFVIVGAYALAFHGAPRFTGDLDFLVRPTESNGERVLAAITAFGSRECSRLGERRADTGEGVTACSRMLTWLRGFPRRIWIVRRSSTRRSSA